jgi:hypothetical protein
LSPFGKVCIIIATMISAISPKGIFMLCFQVNFSNISVFISFPEFRYSAPSF